MTMLITVSAFLLVLFVSWCVCKPLLFAEATRVDADAKTVAVRDQKSRCLQILKDLELDYATKKLSEEDYLKTKDAISKEVAQILSTLDSLNKK